jgi:hypothetical protein
MSEQDLSIKVPPPEPTSPFNWDRFLSVTALVVSVVAAGGALWQARIAERARQDVLQLAKDRPVLHIIEAKLLTATPYHHALQIVLKNTGKAVANAVAIGVDKHTVVSDATHVSKELLSKEEQYGVTAVLNEGDQIQINPGGLGSYSKPDEITMSGTIYYTGEDGTVYRLPWCYLFHAFDAALTTQSPAACIGVVRR